MTLATVLETLPAWIGLGAGGGAGYFFIRWFFEWLGGRVDKREALVDQGFQRLDAGTQALIKHLQEQIASLSSRVGKLEHDLDDCRVKHAESEAKVKQLEATMLGMGDARQTAQAIISAERLKDKGQ